MSHRLAVVACLALGACAGSETMEPEETPTAADGSVDGGVVEDRGCLRENHVSFFRDADGDGFGDPGERMSDCEPPEGYVDNADDCDDTTVERQPGRDDLCDGIDNDCDGETPDGCPADCSQVADGDQIYMVCAVGLNFLEAIVACDAQGMHLIQIESEAEDLWIVDTVSQIFGGRVKFWLGAHDTQTERTWVWPDGTTFWIGNSGGAAQGGAYTDWNGGEPNDDGTEDCAEMRTDGQWNDIPCGERRVYVCERTRAASVAE